MAHIVNIYAENQGRDGFLVSVPGSNLVAQVFCNGKDGKEKCVFEFRLYRYKEMFGFIFFWEKNINYDASTSINYSSLLWCRDFTVFDSSDKKIYLVSSYGWPSKFRYRKARVFSHDINVVRESTAIDDNVTNKLVVISDNTYIRYHCDREAFEIRFNYDESLVNYLKKSIDLKFRTYDHYNKAWFVDVTQETAVMNFIDYAEDVACNRR